MPLRVALFGTNGHQIHGHLHHLPEVELVAVAAIPRERLTPAQQTDTRIRHLSTLDDLLALPEVDVVSLCSPWRRDQAADAIRALHAGKHVYAEKPCAFSEAELDAIMAAAASSGRVFHEMAGTAFAQPYRALREVVASGRLGQIIQVLAQKSYPFGGWRPQDENRDGGLTMQAGVHAFRMVEHVAGCRIAAVSTFETRLGNGAANGHLRVASSSALRLENGGVASVLCNYLNPKAVKTWGNETLRIFGEQGFVEAVDGGTRTRLVIGDQDHGPVDTSAGPLDYFDLMVRELLGLAPPAMSLEAELHPTRMVIRARASAQSHGA